ncbi:MAG: VOC family protein [Anaerolineae bacterium]|nr:VOC family protein [Anaerolineae bacterium]
MYPDRKPEQSIVFLYTEQYAETKVFCETTMGFPLTLDQGGCCIYKIGTDAYLGYCNRPITSPKNGILITLVYDEVDRWYNHLVSCGIKVKGSPKTNDLFGIYHFFFEDPNGYTFEIQRFLDTFPPETS